MAEPDSGPETSWLRTYKGLPGHGLAALAILISLAHLFLAIFPWLSELERNVLHFAGFALLCALIYPMAQSSAKPAKWRKAKAGNRARAHAARAPNAPTSRGATAAAMKGAIMAIRVGSTPAIIGSPALMPRRAGVRGHMAERGRRGKGGGVRKGGELPPRLHPAPSRAKPPPMLRALARLVAFVCFTLAVLAGLVDASRTVASDRTVVTPLIDGLGEVAPQMLDAARASVEGVPGLPWLLEGVLAQPAWAVLGVLALVLWLVGRPREPRYRRFVRG